MPLDITRFPAFRSYLLQLTSPEHDDRKVARELCQPQRGCRSRRRRKPSGQGVRVWFVEWQAAEIFQHLGQRPSRRLVLQSPRLLDPKEHADCSKYLGAAHDGPAPDAAVPVLGRDAAVQEIPFRERRRECPSPVATRTLVEVRQEAHIKTMM